MVRELLQNAVDAIEARRRVDSSWHPRKGKIHVSLTETEGLWKLRIADNGVGMSRNVMTGALLDFGKSLWRSSQLQQEFPGLQGSDFESIGKFGIGFFSVFMVSNSIRVISRRYDLKDDKTWELLFTNGFRTPGVLSQVQSSLELDEWSTCIELKLSKKTIESIAVGATVTDSLAEGGMQKAFLAQSVVNIAPATNVEITISESGDTVVSCRKDFGLIVWISILFC